MRMHFYLLLIFIVFSAAALAVEDCPDKCEGDVRYYDGYYSSGYCHYRTDECDSYDQEYGERFCESGDLYVRYKNYYCTPDGCKYTMYNQKVEDCGSSGCNNGYCIISCDDECDTRDGFYGDAYCKGSSVFRKYRDYYCYGSLCRYSEGERSVEYCPEGCYAGECKGISCPSHCEGDVWFYGGGLISGVCQYIQTDCDTKDRETGSRYCKDNAVYVKFVDYYCSEGCKSVVYERKVSNCEDKCTEGSWYDLDANTLERRNECYSYECIRGTCIQTKSYTVISRQSVAKTLSELEKETITEFDVDVSQKYVQKAFTHPDKRIFNGLFFGSDEIIIELEETEIDYITFFVNDTNQYAPLTVMVNDEVVYHQVAEPGEHKIMVNRTLEKAVIKIRSESSLWVFWSPAAYYIENIAVRARALITETDEYDFIIESNEYDNFIKAAFTRWPRNTDIFINGKVISEGPIPKELLVQDRNTVMFVPWPGKSSTDRAVLTIWYSGKAMM